VRLSNGRRDDAGIIAKEEAPNGEKDGCTNGGKLPHGWWGSVCVPSLETWGSVADVVCRKKWADVRDTYTEYMLANVGTVARHPTCYCFHD
jgi:hypothetical protein